MNEPRETSAGHDPQEAILSGLDFQGPWMPSAPLPSADPLLTSTSASDELFIESFLSSPLPTVLLRLPGRVIADLNPAFETLFGFGREDVLGREIADIPFWEDERERYRMMGRLLRTGEVRDMEFSYRAKSGRTGQGLFFARVLGRRDRHYALVQVVDITELKRQEAVKEAMLSLGTLLSAAATPREAAKVIFETADRLWNWDSGALDVFTPEDDLVWAVMYFDVVDGRRREVPGSDDSDEPTPRMRRIMERGAELILRDPSREWVSDSLVFGDTSRLSASIMSVPIRAQGRVVGVLSIQSYTSFAYREADLRLLQGLADYCGGTLERIRASKGMAELSGRILRVQDEERRRLARELHDTTAQNLAALAMNLGALRQSLAGPDPRHDMLLDDCDRLVDRSAREIRTLSYLLHPPMLDEFGLARAVREYAAGFSRRSGIRLDLDVTEKLGRLGGETELALFRVLQESLGNVHRHSGSPQASVRLARDSRGVVLEVRDAGRGLSHKAQKFLRDGRALGVGIAGMCERLRQLGGHIEVESGAAGTVVRAIVPDPKDRG